MTESETRVTWDKYYRLINSAHPPIDLFEDIADPEDWLLLGSGESKTNPRLAQTIGNLDLVPEERRVGGPGASYMMAPFVHVSPDHQGRFHDGSFGAFYGAESFETALFETVYHTQIFCAATEEAPGWIADKRELIGKLDAVLTRTTTSGPKPSRENDEPTARTVSSTRPSVTPTAHVSRVFIRMSSPPLCKGTTSPTTGMAGKSTCSRT